MAKLSKRKKFYLERFAQLPPLSLEEAIEKLAEAPSVKFDQTVELHFLLNLDPKASDQTVRGTVVLPHGLGRRVRVLVFAKGEAAKIAEEAGADVVGGTELIDKIMNGFDEFDVVVAMPDMMRDVSKLGKILGPRGLMPNPKAGTVTTDVAKAIKEIKAGRIEFKADKLNGVHVGVGKLSFERDKLMENIRVLLDALRAAKPASVKGDLIARAYISTTMGPGLRLNLN